MHGAASSRHAVVGAQGENDEQAVRQALAVVEAEAQTFAWRYLTDANARRAYVKGVKAMSEEILRDIRLGVVSAEEGAIFANQLRNAIMFETRRASTAIGRASASAAKSAGQTLDEALARAVRKLFPGKTFADLAATEKRAVFTEIVEASGRSNPQVTARIPRWTRLGRSLIVVTVAISAINIWMAENRVRQGLEEGATLLGGALGTAAASASAGFVCGPGAPACVTVLFLVGAAAGALIAGTVADIALDQRDIVDWLSEQAP